MGVFPVRLGILSMHQLVGMADHIAEIGRHSTVFNPRMLCGKVNAAVDERSSDCPAQIVAQIGKFRRHLLR